MKKTEINWYKMYREAILYSEKYGHLCVPNYYVTSTGERLGQWIANQRKAYKYRSLPKEKHDARYLPLSNEKVELLEKIGMVWNVSDFQWNNMFNVAQAYYNEHNNLDVPYDYVTTNGEKLGMWLYKQHCRYNQEVKKVKPLTNKQIVMLESIGMDWNSMLTPKWCRMYGFAKKYFSEYGNLNIPCDYVASNGEKLGRWIQHQRAAYKNRSVPTSERNNLLLPLTDRQVILLELIGMVWDVKKNKSYIIEMCQCNGISVRKNSDIINHISFSEFRVKLSYLKDMGINYLDENGLLHEIFSMSSVDLKSKYGINLEKLIGMYNKGMSK